MATNRLQIVVNTASESADFLINYVRRVSVELTFVMDSTVKEWGKSKTLNIYAMPRDSETLKQLEDRLVGVSDRVNSGSEKVSNGYKIPGVQRMRARIVEFDNQ